MHDLVLWELNGQLKDRNTKELLPIISQKEEIKIAVRGKEKEEWEERRRGEERPARADNSGQACAPASEWLFITQS